MPDGEGVPARIRRAAAESGIGPHDMLGPLVEAIADLPDDCARRMDAVVTELSKVAARASDQIAFKAVESLPRAMDRAILGRARMLTAGIVLAALAIGVGGGVWVGVLVGKRVYSPPAELTCEVQRGGYVCFAWLRPATEPTAQPEQSQAQPQPTAAPKKGAAR
jgi:hypothetical protein